MTDAPKLPPLPDGTYDVLIVDAAPHPVHESMLQLEITVVSGEHRGEMLTLGAAGIAGSEIDLMGLPGDLVVVDGVPKLTVDP